MIPFELAEPASLAEAIKLLDPDDASVRPIAGGTALMLMMKAGVFRPAKLVSLRAIKELTAIETQSDGALKIGAMVPLSVLERSAAMRAHAPAPGVRSSMKADENDVAENTSLRSTLAGLGRPARRASWMTTLPNKKPRSTESPRRERELTTHWWLMG